jgi:hypothetical protein
VTIAIVAAFCVVLLIVAFVAPRFSRHLQRGGDAPLAVGERGASRIPVVGRLLSKPFSSSRKAVSKSGFAGRRARTKAPL